MPTTSRPSLASTVAPVRTSTFTPPHRTSGLATGASRSRSALLALALTTAALASGCTAPGHALRTLWREERPEAWRAVEVESAARVGPAGDWWVRVRMHDGRLVEDRIAPWSRSRAHAPWVTSHPQGLGRDPDRAHALPAGAIPVATRAPHLPRVELRDDVGLPFVSDAIVLVEVEGEPGQVLGRYGFVPGTEGPRWRRDRVWLRALITPAAAAIDAALFVINIPYYVLMPRGFHT